MTIRSRIAEVLCFLVHRSGLLLLGCALVRLFGGGGPRVLCYHRVAPSRLPEDLHPDRFAAHLAHLRKRYAFLSATELVLQLRLGEPPPKRGIVITFDDGYADWIEYALPLLRRAGAHAAFFVTTRHLPGPGTSTRRKDAPALIDEKGLNTLLRLGHEVGSHSRTHPILTGIPPAEAEAEIRDSRSELEAVLKSPPELFAYPWGKANEAVASMVDEAGYTGAFTTAGGRAAKGTDPRLVPRIHVPGNASVSRLACEAAGFLGLLRGRR
jgi:peptidoglycan/xylan/chitin deacetylase (PgdA/CDA1 family)